MTRDRQLVAAMAGIWALAGVVEPHLPNAGQVFNEVGLVQGLGTTLLLFSWCKAHARTHSVQIPSGAPLLVAVIAPIGLPYYALRGFGAKKGLRLLGSAIATMIGLSVVYALCFAISARVGT